MWRCFFFNVSFLSECECILRVWQRKISCDCEMRECFMWMQEYFTWMREYFMWMWENFVWVWNHYGNARVFHVNARVFYVNVREFCVRVKSLRKCESISCECQSNFTWMRENFVRMWKREYFILIWENLMRILWRCESILCECQGVLCECEKQSMWMWKHFMCVRERFMCIWEYFILTWETFMQILCEFHVDARAFRQSVTTMNTCEHFMWMLGKSLRIKLHLYVRAFSANVFQPSPPGPMESPNFCFSQAPTHLNLVFSGRKCITQGSLTSVLENTTRCEYIREFCV